MKMKHLRYLLPAILLFSGYGYATAQSMTDIDAILSEARSRDQENRRIQLDLIRRTGAGEMSASLADSLIMVSRQIEKTDRKNIRLVSRLLGKGLPEGLRPESYGTIWLIIDHAEARQQLKYLPAMREAASRGLIQVSELAVLEDRANMNCGKPQKYGTQSYTVTENGNQVIYIWPVEDPETLDTLRSQAGLGTIQEYMLTLKAATGFEVIYDPELTVREMHRRGILKKSGR